MESSSRHLREAIIPLLQYMCAVSLARTACVRSHLFFFVLLFSLLQVTEEQSYALLEYVIHLIAKDYPATLEDLIILGFISPEVGDDPEKVALVVPLLAKVH